MKYLLLSTLALSGLAALAQPQNEPLVPKRAQTWDPATLQALATLPVQQGGRVKPLSTFAAYTLYLTHGRRDLKLDLDGNGAPDVTLTPTEWLLDVWCFPRNAANYPLFRIENTEVLDAIGIEHRGQRFDFEYVSYRQLVTPSGDDGRSPAQRLMELANRYGRTKASQQSPVERHIVHSAEQLAAYDDLHQQMTMLHGTLPLEGSALQAAFGGVQELTFGELLAGAGVLRQLVDGAGAADPGALGNAKEIQQGLEEIARFGNAGPALFPPPGTVAEADTWLGLGDLVAAAVHGQLAAGPASQLELLQAVFTATDTAQRQARLVAFRDAVVAAAKARGDYGNAELETYYQAASWHYKALHWFLLALVVVVAGWCVPRSRWLWVGGLVLTALPLGFLVFDIVLRCVIRGRPPILNLYDTFLFIAGVGVLAALVAEVVTRRRVALSLAPIFGALVVMLARAFEVEEGKDQLAPLQAVLDTNYYLATHVTSINMGYAAGMFAAFLGTAWLLCNALGIKGRDAAFHKSIVRATYGVTGFGLVFAVFGTIYGGVWANDSWGRFWGWDPKENGALLICLSQVAMLHARMVGWVRDLGFCVWSGLTGVVVAFSWFHVNLLEIGLHSYGFASSTEGTLLLYYYVQTGLVVACAIGVLFRRAVPSAATAVAQSAQPVQ